MDSLSSAARAIAEACRDGEKLPGALILCGVLEAAAALWLVIFKEPSGLLKNGKALPYLYYTFLIAAILFGLVEVSVGFWVLDDLDNRRGMGKKILWFSVYLLVFVAGLGGFAFFAPK